MRINGKSIYRKNYLLFNFIFMIILVFLIGFFVGRLQMVSRADTKNPNKYISIRIAGGDTLEAIAEKYNNTTYSNKEFIEHIKPTNNLITDKIYAGSYLIVEQF